MGGYPQHPPPQHPPPPALGAGAGVADVTPPTETVDKSFTVSSCPAGHDAGAAD
ncbi:hypothetical protein GCM10010206_01320 [Streptomyces cinerochromogenes]|nr:hypothetical protein GCM10010206_01320 [Streptomyces cinerochromogenes]